MEIITCGECGIAFGVPEHWLKVRKDTGADFWCPNGHNRVYRETTVQKMEKEKLALQAKINAEAHLRLVAEKERDAERRKRKKIEARISKGVCPCCNRTFENLQRHMRTKHKEYALPGGAQKQLTESVQ